MFYTIKVLLVERTHTVSPPWISCLYISAVRIYCSNLFMTLSPVLLNNLFLLILYKILKFAHLSTVCVEGFPVHTLSVRPLPSWSLPAGTSPQQPPSDPHRVLSSVESLQRHSLSHWPTTLLSQRTPQTAAGSTQKPLSQ